MTIIRTVEELKAIYDGTSEASIAKVTRALTAEYRQMIEASPFLALATVAPEGMDCSPRGDKGGVVRVADDRTILFPDWRGNNRVDSFGNIMSAPGVGLVFMVPGIPETLRVNGKGRATRDAALLAPSTMQERAPVTGIIVEVEEAYFHCGKALIRSKLWDPATQVPRHTFPTLGRIIADQTKAVDGDEADRNLEEAYRLRLY